jgi:hypothetical protein
MSVRALPIRLLGRLDLEESRRKILFLCSSIFLWAWLTLPLAQLSYLHRLGRNAGAVTADLDFLRAQQGLMVPYYRNLFWGALLLSFVGTLLIWLLPRRFANESFLSLSLGLVVGIALGHVWLDLVAPNDPRARVYPVDPTYFMLANAIAGTIAGYLKFKSVEGRVAMEAARQKFHFLAEGVIVWLAVFQVLTVYWVVGPEWTQGLVSAEVQVAFVVPALAWTWLCPLILWRRRPKTLSRSIVWATVIALAVSKIVGISLTVLGVVGRSGAMMASWFIGYIGEGGKIDFFLVLSPSLIWGAIMGLRRWQYLQADKDQPAPASPTPDRSKT